LRRRFGAVIVCLFKSGTLPPGSPPFSWGFAFSSRIGSGVPILFHGRHPSLPFERNDGFFCFFWKLINDTREFSVLFHPSKQYALHSFYVYPLIFFLRASLVDVSAAGGSFLSFSPLIKALLFLVPIHIGLSLFLFFSPKQKKSYGFPFPEFYRFPHCVFGNRAPTRKRTSRLLPPLFFVRFVPSPPRSGTPGFFILGLSVLVDSKSALP